MKTARLVRGVPRNGEMGIGALIIFIALVLVAAVAASVILSTAYVLQQQAQETGDQAIPEVSTGLRIYAMYGDRLNVSNNAIQVVYIKVGLITGSSGVNLRDTVIEIDDGFIEENLIYGTTANVINSNATYARDKAPINTPGEFFVTQGDLAIIRLNVSEIRLNLAPQTFVNLKIIPKYGIPNYETFTTPSAYMKIIMNLT